APHPVRDVHWRGIVFCTVKLIESVWYDLASSPVPAPTTSWTPRTAARQHPVALEILLHGPVSRGELARRLDLSPASLTRLTRPLLDSGLIAEAANHHEPRTGRPRRPLDVVSTPHHFIGVKLTGDDAHAVA